MYSNYFFNNTFLILRIQGINMNFKNYYDILIVLFKKHQLGQLFNLSSVSWDKRIYILTYLHFTYYKFIKILDLV